MVKKLLGQDKSLWDKIRTEIEPLNKSKSYIRKEISEENSNNKNTENNINYTPNIKKLERKQSLHKICLTIC